MFNYFINIKVLCFNRANLKRLDPRCLEKGNNFQNLKLKKEKLYLLPRFLEKILSVLTGDEFQDK